MPEEPALRPAEQIGDESSMWRKIVVSLFCLVAAIATAQTPQAESLPHVEGVALSGKKIVLPDDARGKVSLLVIGFSRKSGDATRAWVTRFRKDFGADPRYAAYPVAVLEDAPRFLRGIILGSMRKNTPLAEQDQFVVIFQGEADLKKVVAYSAADDAYLILLDSSGAVHWRGHGVFREESYLTLRDAAGKLAPHHE